MSVVAHPQAAPGWPDLLRTLLGGGDLSAQQAAWAMEEILAGRASDAQIAGFAIALRAKGETDIEVAALAASMLAHAERIEVAGPVLDVVGTGGDHSGSVNISTMAAVVAAACAVPVVKHGNRAASSQTGTADVLAELGVAISLPPRAVADCLAQVGIGFAFAPVHHPAMRHAAAARRDLGVPTVFNILGPLTNPAGAQASLIGCADPRLAPIMAQVLAHRGACAIVVRGDDGLDEVSTARPSTAWVAAGGEVRQDRIDVADLGVRAARPQDLVGGDPERNASLLRMSLGMQEPSPGDSARVAAIRDAVAVNAAAALVAWQGIGQGIALPLVERIAEQLPRARRAIDGGDAADLMQRWRSVSQELAAG